MIGTCTVANGHVGGPQFDQLRLGAQLLFSLIESWTGASGLGGMSINYLDKRDGQWVQVWNSSGGSQIEIRGGLTDDGMLLVGTLHTIGAATTVPFRGLWTPLEDGRVRQFFELSNDDGKTWTTWFDGYYTRKDTE